MSGLLPSIYAIAIALQADSETRASISTTDDTVPARNVTGNDETYTQTTDESTGTVHALGEVQIGRGANQSMEFIMRGPAGSAPPAADEMVEGRVLRAAGFIEISDPTGIPAEALGGASDNTGDFTIVTLGASASSTDGDYVGYVIQFSDINSGAGVKSTSQIIAYDGATKLATLGEKLDSAPGANYSLPPQLLYRLTSANPELFLTYDKWLHEKRYKHQNLVPGSLGFTFPTAWRSNTQLPVMNASLVGDIDEEDYDSDETAPVVPANASASAFRNGKLVLNGKPVGGQSVTYNHGISVVYPPNPNKTSGNDAPCINRTTREVQLNLNEVLVTEQDRTALANAQGTMPLLVQFGIAPGKTTYFCVPAARMISPAVDPSGEIVSNNSRLVIDGAEKAVCLAYPYFT